MAYIVILGSLLLFVVVIWRVFGSQPKALEVEKGAAPADLQHASIYLNETFIACSAPRPCHGKIDQAFRQADTGMVIPVDSKPFHPRRPYDSDIIQLSAYGYILRHGYGEKVAEFGYIRLYKHGGGLPVYKPVRLMTDQQLEACWDRCRDIKRGQVDRYRTTPWLCRKCEFRRGCKAAA
jgi:CRISPR/Cas system-associated exonuclease Cas4 (RecB family)